MTRLPKRFPSLNRNSLGQALLLAIPLFIAYFWHFQSFGFYEDDYRSIPFLDASWSYMGSYLKSVFTNWPQGRPLNHFLPYLLVKTGYSLGGMNGIYLLGYASVMLHGYIAWTLLRRLAPPAAALIGTLFYFFYPADTTKAFLTHIGHVHSSMAFALVACHLYAMGKRFRWLSYVIATLSLLSYETAFLVFLGFPLVLYTVQWKNIRSQFLPHGLFCGIIVVTLAIVRLRLGESRMTQAAHDLATTLYRGTSSLVIGPFTSLKGFYLAIQDAVQHPSLASNAVLFATFLCISLALWLSSKEPPHTRSYGDAISSNDDHWPRLIKVGLFLWVFSYALTLVNYPPSQLAGRFTSTHIAGSFPFAIFIAGAWIGITLKLPNLWALRNVAISLFIGILTAYHYRIQLDFVSVWAEQKSLWQTIIKQVPEINAETQILLIECRTERSPHFSNLGAANFRVLGNLFTYPQRKRTPTVGIFHPQYTSSKMVTKITFANGQWLWEREAWKKIQAPPEPLTPEHLTILQLDDNNITRLYNFPIPSLNQILEVPRTVAPGTPPIGKRPFYEILLSPTAP